MTTKNPENMSKAELVKALKDAKASANGAKPMSFKVSAEKGALSIYGLQRFPVTLYREQWERILAASDKIRSFIEANDSTLTTKD